jgi:hypothetical protein
LSWKNVKGNDLVTRSYRTWCEMRRYARRRRKAILIERGGFVALFWDSDKWAGKRAIIGYYAGRFLAI